MRSGASAKADPLGLPELAAVLFPREALPSRLQTIRGIGSTLLAVVVGAAIASARHSTRSSPERPGFA